MALVEADDLAGYLTRLGSPARSTAVAADAATTASAFVVAYCTRLRSAPDGLDVAEAPAPVVVRRVALHLAARLASNPQATKSVSAEGQSVDYAPVGLLYLEGVLLNSYRRRTA